MRFVTSLWAAGAALFAATAQAAAPSGYFAIVGSGAHGWTIECSIARGTKSDRTFTLRGIASRDREALALRDVTGGQCAYRAGPTAGFVIEFRDEAFECPFPEADGICRRAVEPEQTGTIDVKLKP